MPRFFSQSVLVVAAIAATGVSAWPQFMAMIPNAATVEYNVIDVGHKQGTIVRHQFGRDFGVGRNWTKELCEGDSDKDGQTNGQELGDPCCVWSTGYDDLLAFTTGMSNPGNATSLADPNLWKNLDCATIQKNAAAKKAAASPQGTPAPAGTSGAASVVVTTAGVASVVVASTLALW